MRYGAHMTVRSSPSSKHVPRKERRYHVKKFSDVKFHGNPTSGSRAVPCGLTGRLTGMTMLKVAFSNSVNTTEIVLSARTARLSVLYGSQNKQRLFTYTA